jgi:hypothetical protein
MNAVSSKRMLGSYSDNPKWLGCAIVLTFIFGGVAAQAQQPAKIPRIGYLSATGSSSLDLGSMRSVRATRSRGKISRLVCH